MGSHGSERAGASARPFIRCVLVRDDGHRFSPCWGPGTVPHVSHHPRRLRGVD